MTTELISSETKAKLREACNETIGCIGNFVLCRNGYCKCQQDLVPDPNDNESCTEPVLHTVESPRTDPTMIGVVIGLALMSVTLCVVMRLFAKARFRENRTIFNTANPRLMNVKTSSKKISKQSSGKGNHNHNASGSRGRRNSQGSLQSADCPSEHLSTHLHQQQLRSHPEGTEVVGNTSPVEQTRRGPPTEMELQMEKFERLEAAGHI